MHPFIRRPNGNIVYSSLPGADDAPERMGVPMADDRSFFLRWVVPLIFAALAIAAVGGLVSHSWSGHALASPWALWALMIVAAVWAADRFQLVAPPILAAASVVLYGLSMCVPALSTSDVDGAITLVMGWSAFLGSFLVLPGFVVELLFGRNVSSSEIWSLVVFIMGALANLAFIVGYTLLLVGSVRPRWKTAAHDAALIGAILSLAIVVPMSFGDSFVVYPGYGLWAASSLALWLGARHERAARSKQS
jgi:hypothetical protein